MDTDIVIIDEIDYVLIDMQTNIDVYDSVKKGGKFKKSKKMPTIIGLTATDFNELNPDEQMFLTGSHHNFRFQSSTIPMSFTDLTLRRTVDEFLAMMETDYKRYALLIYMNEHQIKYFTERMNVYRSKFTAIIHQDVEDLTQIANMRSGDVYFVTKKELMRGFHYHCDEGIGLFIMKEVDSKKAFTQALGRVGRYGDDKCVRVIDKNLVNNIDERGRLEIMNKIKSTQLAKESGNNCNLTQMLSAMSSKV